MPPTTRSALIYARQSKDKAASIDQQEQAGKARATEEGWPVHDVYRDGESASRHAAKKREDWPRLLRDLARPDVGTLWLWESSRGDRNLATWAGMLDRCREHNVRIYVETHERLYNVNNPRDWRTLAEDGVDSHYESDKTSVRVLRASADNARLGKPWGRAPYGYRREYGIDSKGKRVLVRQYVEPAEAAVVKRIFDDIEKRQSLREIAAKLNADGVPTVTGVDWSAFRVRDVGMMAAYAGKRKHNPEAKNGHRRHDLGTLTDAIWPKIIEPEQYWAVRELLTDPKRRTTRPGRARHLLSMFTVCGVCDGPMAVRRDPKRDESYWCVRKGCIRIPKTELDEHVETLILARLADPAEYRHLHTEEATAELLAARNELADVQADYDQTVRLFAERKISPTAFAAVEPAKQADLHRAQALVRELETPTQLRSLLGGSADDAIGVRWEATTPVARRAVVRLLFERLAVLRAPSRGHRGPVEQRLDYQWRKRPQSAAF